MQTVQLPPSPLDVLAPEKCLCGYGDCCVCPDTERALRHAMETPHPFFSAEQRDWCLSEICKVEGYCRENYETAPDPQLARGVINAWTDYCRDKGLL